MRTRPAVPVLDLVTTDAYSDWLRPIIWRLLDQHDGARILAQFGWQVTYGLTPLLTATKEAP